MADRPNRFDRGGDQRCYYGTGRRPDPPRSHAGLIVLLLLLFFRAECCLVSRADAPVSGENRAAGDDGAAGDGRLVVRLAL